MQIGNVSLNPEAFKDYTKEQFFEEFKGKLSIDKEIVWKQICEINGYEKITLKDTGELTDKNHLDESFGKTSKQRKKP